MPAATKAQTPSPLRPQGAGSVQHPASLRLAHFGGGSFHKLKKMGAVIQDGLDRPLHATRFDSGTVTATHLDQKQKHKEQQHLSTTTMAAAAAATTIERLSVQRARHAYDTE